MSPARVSNIADPLVLHGRQRPSQIAIIRGDQAVDYRTLDRQVSERAAHLQDLGVRPGQSVGVALSDSIEHLVILYAVARAGAVILPMDWRWLPFEKRRLRILNAHLLDAQRHASASVRQVRPGPVGDS